MTKKELALGMYEKGMPVEHIAELLHSDPSYVANTLIEQGHAPNYVDLYTSTGPQNRYAATMAGVLRFKNLDAAQESVKRLHELWTGYAAIRDRRGMHQCEVLALVGKNRAEGVGKWREAQVFAEWLAARLTVERPVPVQLTILENEEPELARAA